MSHWQRWLQTCSGRNGGHGGHGRYSSVQCQVCRKFGHDASVCYHHFDENCAYYVSESFFSQSSTTSRYPPPRVPSQFPFSGSYLFMPQGHVSVALHAIPPQAPFINPNFSNNFLHPTPQAMLTSTNLKVQQVGTLTQVPPIM